MDEQMMRETLGEQKPESFEELIAGRYHGDFTRKVQQLMDRRFAGAPAEGRAMGAVAAGGWRSSARIAAGPGGRGGADGAIGKEGGRRERREAFGNGRPARPCASGWRRPRAWGKDTRALTCGRQCRRRTSRGFAPGLTVEQACPWPTGMS